MTDQVGHIMDLMPTFLEIAGVDYPASKQDRKLTPLEGLSLLPILEGRVRKEHGALYWKFGQCRAVRMGKWKLVTPHPNPRLGIDFFKPNQLSEKEDRKEMAWELYDLKKDGTELHNLAEDFPGRVREMTSLFRAWVSRVQD